MGNIFSRFTGNNVNISNRSTKAEPNSEYRRNSGLKADVSLNQQIPPPEPYASPPLKTAEDTPPKKPKLQPKPVELIEPQKEPLVYTTTFETQIDAAPPHPLEEKLRDEIQFDEIEIETNLFTPEVEDAVIKIQAGIRGYLARKQVKELKRDSEEVGDNNRLLSHCEEPSIVPPPQHFDDTESKNIEEISGFTDPSNEAQYNECQKLLKLLEKRITTEQTENETVVQNGSSLENKSTVIESQEINEINNDLNALKDKKSIENENIKEKENRIEPSISDNLLVKEVVNTSDVPLLKTSSEKAVEKLKESKGLVEESVKLNENISTVDNLIESSPKCETIEKVTESSDKLIESKPQEEKKPEEKTIEEQVVEVFFEDENIVNNNKVIAIEIFKQDISEQELAKVTTINEPETKKRVEDRVYKTSLDQFVVKPVEQKPESAPVLSSEINSSLSDLDSGIVPVLEEQLLIKIDSRKNSVEAQEIEIEPQVIQVQEIIPQPLIQVEEQNGTVLDEEEAAIRIQAAFRGYQIRRSLSREASPNRANNNNNNSSDSNQQIQTQMSHELFINSNQNEPQLEITNESHGICGNHAISDEEIRDNSLERLEDQLLQELIASDECNDKFTDNSLDSSQLLVDGIDQKSNLISLNEPMIEQNFESNETNQPKEEIKVLEQTFPEVVTDEAQVLDISEDNKNVEINLTEKPNNLHFDAIVVDLSESNPNDSHSVEIDSHPVPEDIRETSSKTNTSNVNIDKESHDFTENSNESSKETESLIDIEKEPDLKQVEEKPLVETSSENLETNLMPALHKVEGPEPESHILTQVEPPTPAEITEISPQTMFIFPEKPILTKIGSSESEQDSESLTKHEKPSQIPKLESKNKLGLDSPQKRGILKETETKILHNITLEEQTQSTSEEISSPDDDPEYIGLGPNTPIPVRASSPNPFGKRRRGKKRSGARKN